MDSDAAVCIPADVAARQAARDKLREAVKMAFKLGFMISREGYNGDVMIETKAPESLEPHYLAGEEANFLRKLMYSKGFRNAMDEALRRLTSDEGDILTDGRCVHPGHITEDMVCRVLGKGLPVDPFHAAASLNAMLEDGYCSRCGLVPVGCVREGCGPSPTAEEVPRIGKATMAAIGPAGVGFAFYPGDLVEATPDTEGHIKAYTVRLLEAGGAVGIRVGESVRIATWPFDVLDSMPVGYKG